MKKTIVAITSILILGTVIFFLFYPNNNKDNTQDVAHDQKVLESTLDISKEYVALRHQTDNLLIDAESYNDYYTWKKELDSITSKWEALEQSAILLETSAKLMSEEKIGFRFVRDVNAYNQQEISDIFDRAPAGKKIATLAKHLGVDAKTAFKMLKQDQAQVEADAWNKAGDTFQTLESVATGIKDACKVTVFVGTIAATGGTAALASASTLSQTAVIVSGADLTLEVTSDAAKIGLGNFNKISGVIDTARVVTEPLATILTISSVPENLATGFDKFNAVMLGLEQFNSAAQDGKIAGVVLPAYTGNKSKGVIKVSVIEKEEVGKWMEAQGIEVKDTVSSAEEINTIVKNILENNIEKKDLEIPDNSESTTEEPKILNESSDAIGIWEGTSTWTASAGEAPQSSNIIFELKSDNSINVLEGTWNSPRWEQIDNLIRFYGEDEKDGYHEFLLAGDTLTFIKIAGPDQEDPTKWVEIFAGEDFFGGKYMEIVLKRQ